MYSQQRAFVRMWFGLAMLGLLTPQLLAGDEGRGSTDNQAMVERGRYLVTIAGCHDCHTPKVLTPEGPALDQTKLLSGHPADAVTAPIPQGVPDPEGWMAMTNFHLTEWAGPWGVSFARNLTPDVATGLGSWTEEMFIKALRTGKDMGEGRPILPPMPWEAIGQMTDDDLKSVFAYLHSIPAIPNAVPDPVPPPAHTDPPVKDSEK